MKRSEINRKIGEAKNFFGEMKFHLPPWGSWAPEEWRRHGEDLTAIIENGLGWDLTDFGSGAFDQTGLLLFTIRNGGAAGDHKTYAEKIMIVEEGQVTPMHFHWSKMEDIINRGGGNLMIRLHPSNAHEEIADHDFGVSLDGILKSFWSGEVVRLEPGESITLYPGLYHSFWGEPDKGKVLVGEVSAVNDDHSDNRFLKEVGRFPEIEEDEAPLHLLVGDYASFL